MAEQTPTIGRRVYFWPSLFDLANGMSRYDAEQPFEAGVSYVWSPTCVNLSVTDHAGVPYARTSVPFGAPVNEGGSYADWMPYQKGASHTPAPGANVHGIGPDVGAGPNPHRGDLLLGGAPEKSIHPFPAFAPSDRSEPK